MSRVLGSAATDGVHAEPPFIAVRVCGRQGERRIEGRPGREQRTMWERAVGCRQAGAVRIGFPASEELPFVAVRVCKRGSTETEQLQAGSCRESGVRCNGVPTELAFVGVRSGSASGQQVGKSRKGQTGNRGVTEVVAGIELPKGDKVGFTFFSRRDQRPCSNPKPWTANRAPLPHH